MNSSNNEDLDTYLLTAIQENHRVDEITSLIDRGADVNAHTDNGATPMHNAAFSNKNPAVIDALVSRGADVNARNNLLGQTPLHVAVEFTENPAVIEMLATCGADINARDNLEQTPLELANEHNPNPEVTRLLRSRSTTATSSSGHLCVLAMLWSFRESGNLGGGHTPR